MTNIIESQNGTPLLDICPVYESNDEIVVDLRGSSNEYEGEYEYNYETEMWETVAEKLG